jgi:hypothetical protein
MPNAIEPARRRERVVGVRELAAGNVNSDAGPDVQVVSRRCRKGLGEQGSSHRRRATLFCHPNNTLMQSRTTNEGKPLYNNGPAANCVRHAGFR